MQLGSLGLFLGNLDPLPFEDSATSEVNAATAASNVLGSIHCLGCKSIDILSQNLSQVM